MLDWIRERNQGWFAKIILLLVLVPFALFGVNSYLNRQGTAEAVAVVNGEKISRNEFEHALKLQREQISAQMGANADSSVLDGPLLKQQVLDSLIRRRVLLQAARKVGMVVSDRQLADFIGMIPAFQENGKFNLARYQQLLRQQNMSVPQFEALAREELLLQALQAAFMDSPQVSRVAVQNFIQDFDQQREISTVELNLADAKSKISVTPAQVQAYYAAHSQQFVLPPRAKFQYLVLSLADLAQHIPVSSADVAAYYNQHQAEFSTPEQREARHILIAVKSGSTPQQRDAAKRQADDIYHQLQQHPEKFAALAKQYSADAGSAAQGGELGWFGRDDMVKPFSDTVFSLKKGQISAPVLTDYGWHIIQLEDIHPAGVRGLAETTNEITALLQKERAAKQFADAAERFSNQVFEQPDSLSGVASALHLSLQTSDWVTRQGSATAVLNTPKMLQALFSNDVMQRHHNTDAIEVSPNVLVAARMLEAEPARTQTLAEVDKQITTQLTVQAAHDAVAQEGADWLAQLRNGREPSGIVWSKAINVSRMQPGPVSPALLTAVFSADADKLPMYAGQQDAAGNFQLVRITRVLPSSPPNADKFQAFLRQLGHMQTSAAFDDYARGLVAQAKVVVHLPS